MMSGVTSLLFLWYLSAIAIAQGVCRNLRGVGQESDDIFVISYRWSPAYCDDQPANRKYPRCQRPTEFMKHNFVINDMWIQSPTSTEVTSNCAGSVYQHSLMREIGWSDLVHYWPNFLYDEYDDRYQSHWEAAWDLHGKCTGLSQEDFFKHAIEMIKSTGTPKSISDGRSSELPVDVVKPALGSIDAAVALQCQGKEYLFGALICWAKGPDGNPLIQDSCPVSVKEMDTCTLGLLKIPSFDSSASTA